MGQILLVRHGQASFGAADYDVLSETGWEQGRVLGAWLARIGVVPTAVLRGGLRRHRETWEALREGAGWGEGSDAVVEEQVDTDWDEFDHLPLVASYPDLPAGELDRRGFQEVFERATAAWASGEHAGDFETYAAFVGRAEQALHRAAASAGSGQTVVVVTSGGVIAAVCAALVDGTGAPGESGDPVVRARLWNRFNTVIANSSFTRVTVGATGSRLLTFNEHPHLDAALRTYR